MSAGLDVLLDDVAMQYVTPGGPVRALDAVSLEIGRGESLAIMGPSGCGKSTLLGLLAGLEAPTRGRVRVGGEEISRQSERERSALRRRSCGLVFQLDNLLAFLTVLENVRLQLALGDGDSAGDERCHEVLAALGLSREVDKLPDQLSGGQRQRVAVARAVVHRPGLILADEPTGALDTANSSKVIDLLLQAQRESGATLVMVTHDPGAAGRMAQRVALRDGRLVEGVPTAHAR